MGRFMPYARRPRDTKVRAKLDEGTLEIVLGPVDRLPGAGTTSRDAAVVGFRALKNMKLSNLGSMSREGEPYLVDNGPGGERFWGGWPEVQCSRSAGADEG